MLKSVLFASSLLALSGCSGGTKTKIEPAYTPMEFPLGYSAVFSGVITDLSGETYIEETPFECPITQTSTGVAGDYCGFAIEVFETDYSFDLKKPYYTFSWYWGWLEIMITGEGDANGSSVYVEGHTYPDPELYSWTYDYTITHVGDMVIGTEE